MAAEEASRKTAEAEIPALPKGRLLNGTYIFHGHFECHAPFARQRQTEANVSPAVGQARPAHDQRIAFGHPIAQRGNVATLNRSGFTGGRSEANKGMPAQCLRLEARL